MNQPGQSAAKYGFGGRLSAAFPSQIVIDSTELCNLECVHCPHPQFKRSEVYSGRRLDPDLSNKAIDEISQAGKGACQYVRFTGEGEPLLHVDIFEMLQYAVRNSGTAVTVTTNGTLHQGGKLEKLMATEVDIIDVSIDALLPETYAQIRVKGDLNVTRENVRRLIQMSKSPGCKTKVVVSYIEQPQNADQTDDFERFWKDEGADYVVIRRMHSNAGSLVQLADQMRSANDSQPRRACLYPWERMILNPRGMLAFCPVDWVNGSAIADYRETTIAETWQGEFYRRLREAHLTNCYGDHSFCEQCPDWKQTRWPEDGRSYADMVQDFKDRE